ncbi:bifunctional adenosylcobinamide kinase/adenosylcobinamide-phosphate guanylyltransferase [Neobacillus sp. CF12]|uniref:bifunctional adenosylcobinamide kinase/adenosylcobinamide-phosphate guanylyltransferase n=1 Tax=Neobacillus sp. CF12 TaxID=3055864 RepID=UPI0025A19E2E|nr:bifunctional adenosylcobinamide kinase/adenosylcobinamide-phosphate guanylyltransferase [Neobacillus sp. CF12]MDM5327286.1 bifunctional adenosylcobinamide kinase/adenosylcobinamide-phosphate guanylyltransferase [Neobacillus sp. CF12]
MHFITGGSFNGKRAWVKKTYGLTGTWLSAYQDTPLTVNLAHINSDLLVLEGIEIWLKELTKTYDSYRSREIWIQTLNQWLSWEEAEPQRKLVVIGTDITKGIVPVEKENRLWRDVTGWAYQDLAAKAEKVDVIWYGLNQTIKLTGDEKL